MDEQDMMERLRRKDQGIPEQDEEPSREERDPFGGLQNRSPFEEDEEPRDPFGSGNGVFGRTRTFSLGGGGSCLGCLFVLILLGVVPFFLIGAVMWGFILFAVFGVLALLRHLF